MESNIPLGRRYREINAELDNLEFGSGQWMKLYSEQNRIEAIIVERNLKGRELEKQGKIEAAIKLYERNVADEVDTPFPYIRLAIIYRKQKRPEDEIRILEKAIEIFTCLGANVADWQKQLSKAKQKLE